MPLGVDCKGSALQVMRKGSQVVGLPPYGMTYGSVQDLCYKLQEQVKLQKVSNIIYNCQWNLTNILPTARPTTPAFGSGPRHLNEEGQKYIQNKLNYKNLKYRDLKLRDKVKI